MRKNCSGDWEKLLKFEAEGREFAKNFEITRTIYSNSGVNGILLPKLFWPTVRKNCSSDQEKVLNLQNFWDHWNNLFKQWKVRTFLVTECFFNLFLEIRTIIIQIGNNYWDLETYRKSWKIKLSLTRGGVLNLISTTPRCFWGSWNTGTSLVVAVHSLFGCTGCTTGWPNTTKHFGRTPCITGRWWVCTR